MPTTKNRRPLIIALAMTAVVAGAVIAFLGTRGAGHEPGADARPTAAAGFGDEDVKAELWTKLARYRETYLAGWDDAFKTGKPRAITIVKAFKAVAEKVTGPDGFWRDEVPNNLLACHQNPDSAPCGRLEASDEELGKGDDLVREIERLDDSRADVWLQRNGERLVTYLDTMVPESPDEAAMQRTAFYTQRIAPNVAGTK
ncbi:MAG: hypothetical protein KC635_00955 [Myxococcales bacterium]|nr:hypothetical protein [Myxococcales bacterium]MCB9736436.1 hypothetical protein [Deltaproteobacteria bacterium]